MSARNLRWIVLLIVDKSPLQNGECIFLPRSLVRHLLTYSTCFLPNSAHATNNSSEKWDYYFSKLLFLHSTTDRPPLNGGEGTLSLL